MKSQGTPWGHSRSLLLLSERVRRERPAAVLVSGGTASAVSVTVCPSRGARLALADGGVDPVPSSRGGAGGGGEPGPGCDGGVDEGAHAAIGLGGAAAPDVRAGCPLPCGLPPGWAAWAGVCPEGRHGLCSGPAHSPRFTLLRLFSTPLHQPAPSHRAPIPPIVPSGWPTGWRSCCATTRRCSARAAWRWRTWSWEARSSARASGCG